MTGYRLIIIRQLLCAVLVCFSCASVEAGLICRFCEPQKSLDKIMGGG